MTQLQLTFGQIARPKRVTVTQRRTSKREEIEQLFTANVGQRFGTNELHQRFGTSFRTRVSEINRSDAAVVIRNEVKHDEGGREASVYWAEFKQ